MTDTDVAELPRRTKPLFRRSVGACTRFLAGQAAPAMPRLALVVSTPPPSGGADAAVCVPATAFASWEDHAVEVCADREAKWLLTLSMQVRHLDEARADLLHAAASALVAAAIDGVDNVGRHDDLTF